MTLSFPLPTKAAEAADRPIRLPNPDALLSASRDVAAICYETVAQPYLSFRHIYYHEERPSLATTPPSHDEVTTAEAALLAENMLGLLPKAIKTVPVLGGFLRHLEQVANIHSMSERERTALHNAAMMFLHGVNGGIQPWYVEWLLATAQRLSHVTHPEYYMSFPWDGVLYLDPRALALFERAVRAGDVNAIEGTIQEIATRLSRALADPIGSQPALAFTGPDSEHRRTVFDLKTGAALALATYLVAEEARSLWHPRPVLAAPVSALAEYPPEILAHMVPARQAVPAAAATA